MHMHMVVQRVECNNNNSNNNNKTKMNAIRQVGLKLAGTN